MARTKKIITRYAPSPTGFQHVGNIRTALFAYLWAKRSNGEFILRIEDTDKNREVEGAIQHTIDSLKWLGISWDYGPEKKTDERGPWQQSERLETYKKYAYRLLDKGLAYQDPFTEEELSELRTEAENRKKPFLFREYRPDTLSKEWDETTPLRFRVPEIKRYEWKDVVLGNMSAGEEMLDDFILIKSDGYPTYNFAHIIDDHEMGVTHVMRGQEFVSSMPKFLSLIEALRFEHPEFVTLPPIMGPDGKKKLSKRDGAKDLLEYREDGYLSEAMCNFLALIGWNPGTEQEIFSKQELIESFSLQKIQRSGGAFNIEKLNWMNKEHLSQLTIEAKQQYVASALPDLELETAHKLSNTILERVHNKVEIEEAFTNGEYDWAIKDIDYDRQLLHWKRDDSLEMALPRLRKLHELLQNADFISPESIKTFVWSYAEKVGKGEVFWPLRVALSGKARSPDPFTIAFVLGKDQTLARIKVACDKIKG